MTDQERNQILKMIENGKITPEEGLKLMQALDQIPAEDPASETGAGVAQGAQAEESNFGSDPRIARVKALARRLWQIPLWIGVATTVLSALGMYWVMRAADMNFWFYCLSLPLLLGVAVMAAAVGSRRARWIFVDVQHNRDEWPRRIFLGFPLPLKLAAWFLRTFGDKIPDLKKTNVDEIIQVIETGFQGDEPLVVNVDEGEEGERVQVYIG